MKKTSSHEINLKTVITCQSCGMAEEIMMHPKLPEQKFVCKKCSAELLAQAGECCVFCSYGSVKCPPIQEIAKRLGHMQ